MEEALFVNFLGVVGVADEDDLDSGVYYIGASTGEVIDVKTRKVVATLKDENGNPVRGEKYKQIKQEFADIILSRVEKALNTEIKSHIEYLDIATPVTHYRYTGNKNGTMMGARPGKDNYKAKIAHYKTPLENVYLSGHWANLGGGVPIAVSTAANSTLLILQKENPTIFKALGAFFDGKIERDELNQKPGILPYANNWEMNPTPAEKKAARTVKEDQD